MFLKHTDSPNIEFIVTAVFRSHHFHKHVHFVFLFEIVGVMVFLQLLKSSVNVSRRQFVQ